MGSGLLCGTKMEPLLRAAKDLSRRFGHTPSPFDDGIWGGSVDALRAAIRDAEARLKEE
jgi:hypothetical protein